MPKDDTRSVSNRVSCGTCSTVTIPSSTSVGEARLLGVVRYFEFDNPSQLAAAKWSLSGMWDRAWERLIPQFDKRGQTNWNEGFANGTFAAAKKGRLPPANTLMMPEG